MGLIFKCWHSDATFLYLFDEANMQAFGQVPQAWMMSQIGQVPLSGVKPLARMP